MPSRTDQADRSPPGEGRACAGALPLQEAQHDKDKTASDSEQPSAGRTGKSGAKAERPADSRLHKSSDGGSEPARDGKAPSPAARDEANGAQLPQPVRDATG